MTMFSMKPQFNMAEFLAVPAKRDGFKRRITRNVAPESAAAAVPAEKAVAAPPKKNKP